MSGKDVQMISEEEARSILLAKTSPLGSERVPVEAARGATLAEEVVSDVDMPPFDRAAMDGYAVRLADVAATPVELAVVEHIKAGDVPKRALGAGECSEIMTGAPVPEGADGVVQVEHTEPAAENLVRILEPLAGKTNIARQGEDLGRGDVVLEPGRVLRSAEVGLLAMVGRREVEIHQRPRVAILATGDELIEPAVGRVPRPGQTRNCNNFSLLAECARAGFQATALGIARDTREELETKIRAGLEADVLLVSGGVSMGKYDLVPEVFEALGVVVHFTKVAIKPGKPTVFATRGKKLVFGLPGNPVSVIVVFRLFVEPALRRLAGQQVVLPRLAFVRLAAPVRNRGDRRSYLPVRLRSSDRELLAEPVPSHGSADLMALTNADALIQVEAGAGEVSAGAEVPALLLEG